MSDKQQPADFIAHVIQFETTEALSILLLFQWTSHAMSAACVCCQKSVIPHGNSAKGEKYTEESGASAPTWTALPSEARAGSMGRCCCAA